MIRDDERREVAARLRGIKDTRDGCGQDLCCELWSAVFDSDYRCTDLCDECEVAVLNSLADLIEPSYKPDAEYEAWYNSLSHLGDERGGPSTIHELIEEIVWTALTVDLGPNGNTDSTGVDEGCVYTNKLFSEWEREALLLSGGAERTCTIDYDDVHQDYVCSRCGERYESDMYAAATDDGRTVLMPMHYCPYCGARVVEK